MEMAQNAIEWGNKHQSERLVTIRYRVYDDRIEIIVRDQGRGFDRENLPHAAAADDPFSHLDVRDKLGLRAGGFGLMICKGMVDELTYNDVGNEVTLTKRFRSQAAELTEPPTRSAPPGPTARPVPRPEAFSGMTTHRPTLLVVDDEPEVLHSVHDLLRLDYRVLTCERGADAVRGPGVAPRTIHVVMSDQRMPGHDGRRGPAPRQAAPPRGDPADVHRLRRHQGRRRRDQPGERLPLHHQALGPRRAPGRSSARPSSSTTWSSSATA